MRVGKNVTIYAGEDTRASREARRDEVKNKDKEKQDKRNTVFAGDLGLDNDMIRQKRMDAQKKALKVVTDAWNGDKEAAAALDGQRERLKQLRSDMGGANREIAALSDEQAALKESMGVTPDSQEQQDLELLLKRRAAEKPGSGVELAKEEKARLAEIDERGLTDYQERYLSLEDAKAPYQATVEKCKGQIEMINSTVSDMKLEMLKYAPMVKASKDAEAIKEAASKEIIGMLVEEGKEHIEKEQEEKAEKAEEAGEKKEEQEAVLEKRKEEREKAEELVEDLPLDEMLTYDKMNTDSGVQAEVRKIMDKLKLLEEDMKGAVVDEAR